MRFTPCEEELPKKIQLGISNLSRTRFDKKVGIGRPIRTRDQRDGSFIIGLLWVLLPKDLKWVYREPV
jgi:hypothetical protein